MELAFPSIEVLHHSSSLLSQNSKEEFTDNLKKAIDLVADFLDRDSFYSGASVSDLKGKMRNIISQSDKVASMEEAFSELKGLYLDHAIAFHHPSYVAHLNCPVLIPALVGDIIASAVNTAVETWDQSTSATLIEQEIMKWTCQLFQLPKSSDGVFTSGGTQSNFMGLLMARDHFAFHRLGVNLKQYGVIDELRKFRIFCSDKAHFSVKKNAALLGLGYNAVVTVETDEAFKMKPEALKQAIEQEKMRGNLPIAVVATAGTTDYGSIDPIEAINEIAKSEGMWLHVDGAYGGCYAITSTHKDRLLGAQYADSITIDFHKTLFQPVCSSAFLVADAQNFKYVSHYADYLNPIETKDECDNLIVKSIQTTRRFDALKLWMTLRVTEVDTLAGFLEAVHFLALDAYDLLKKQECFELAHLPELSTVVFRYTNKSLSDQEISDINLAIKKQLFDTGTASVASTKLDGNTYLKFTLLNPMVTKDDIAHIVQLITERGNALVAQK